MRFGPLQFDSPFWLLIAIPAVILTVWIGRKTLSGMGTTARRVALAVRIIVLVLLCMAAADPKWRLESDSVAVTVIADASRSMTTNTLAQTEAFVQEASKQARKTDLVGLVTTAREGLVQSMPGLVGTPLDVRDVGTTDSTNLESGIRLGMAVMPQTSANRILLISDGNETSGSLLAAAKSAQAAKVPIDVLPQRFVRDREVIVERVIVPATAREGDTVKVRALITATKATSGRLNILMNGVPQRLSDEQGQTGAMIDVPAGTSRQEVSIALPRGRDNVRFEAVFEPVAGGDTIIENNRATGVTFVSGEGRVLVLSSSSIESEPLVKALRSGGLIVLPRAPQDGFDSLASLGSFEGVVLVNVAASEFSLKQQEELLAYVRDLGGGLVVIGGDKAFGAGGWIGSPLADAFPVRLDPPQKRQMPRGALALVMHSCEVPQGNYWGKRTAEAAIEALSARDLVGIYEHSPTGGDGVVHPMSEVGDKGAALRAANAMNYGDAPSFVPMLAAALAQLRGVAAGQKHVILISDGDPAPPSDAMVQDFVANKISISTVAVFPHTTMGGDLRKMEDLAKATGGAYHLITKNGQLESLPQIFIKEAQVVKRTLLWEGEGFSPKVEQPGTEGMRGIGTLPQIVGYVVTADKEGLAQVVLRGQENDPVLAQWQFGLGRVVTYAGDATSRWSSAWLPWSQFEAFWSQHTRWAMRPASNPNLRVVTTEEGDRTRIIVEAVDDKGDRQNFLAWQAAAVTPDNKSLPFSLQQVGPGRYEATIPTAASGSYTVNLGYNERAADGRTTRGSVQAVVTRPFADEFRALSDNALLLEQIAKLTGGRVLKDFSATDNLWLRDGLVMPVALRTIGLTVAIIAIALFLTDVAVRRVRIDFAAIAAAVGRAFGKTPVTSGGGLDALRTARGRAQASIDKRKDGGRGAAGISMPLAQSEALVATRKFEASDSELSQAAREASNFAEQAAARIDDKTRKPQPGTQGASDVSEEEGMSRLMKAKKRAKEDMQE